MSYVDNAQRHDAILMREETGNEVVPLQWRKKKKRESQGASCTPEYCVNKATKYALLFQLKLTAYWCSSFMQSWHSTINFLS